MGEALKGKDDDEFLIVEDKALLNQEDPKAKVEEHDEEDKRLAAQDDAAAKDDAEREALRERRRMEKAERKDRREQAIKRNDIERNFLLKRNEELERRLTAQEQNSIRNDLNNIDGRIAYLQNQASQAETVHAKAVTAGNGEDATQALRYRDQAINEARALAAQKQQLAQAAQQTGSAVAPPMMTFAKEFIDANSWYDPHGNNEDSAIMIALDGQLAREGFDPNTQAFWDELESRGAKRLPDRFKQTTRRADHGEEQETRQSRGGPPVGSGREHAPASTRKEIYISPERKQALIEAGVWDDPVLRNKFVKRYAEYDKQNKA